MPSVPKYVSSDRSRISLRLEGDLKGLPRYTSLVMYFGFKKGHYSSANFECFKGLVILKSDQDVPDLIVLKCSNGSRI